MKHYMCTNAGESTEFYQHLEDYMKGGEGQGERSSPSNWLFQSSTFLKSLEVQCNVLYLTSVDRKYESKQVAEGYVDDCDAVTADQQIQEGDMPEMIQEKCNMLLRHGQTSFIAQE
eukprot:455575-Ditylum_brightwellii.AAC.1